MMEGNTKEAYIWCLRESYMRIWWDISERPIGSMVPFAVIQLEYNVHYISLHKVGLQLSSELSTLPFSRFSLITSQMGAKYNHLWFFWGILNLDLEWAMAQVFLPATNDFTWLMCLKHLLIEGALSMSLPFASVHLTCDCQVRNICIPNSFSSWWSGLMVLAVSWHCFILT